MSKIGKQPIMIPRDIATAIEDARVVFKGATGEIRIPVLKGIQVVINGNTIICSPEKDDKQTRSNWGTQRSLLANAVDGLTKGFEKTLLLEGVGYRITKEGNNLSMTLGFSHPVRFSPPEGIICEVEKNTVLKIKGFNKELVGETAARIRALKKPEPYKGTGFRYATETIRRKAGKKATATTVK